MFNKFLFAGILSFSILAGCQTKEEKNENLPAVKDQPAEQKSEQQTEQQNNNDSIVIKVRYYPSGAVETETEYVNGVRNGMHKLYAEDGNLLSEVRYVNNKMEGMMKTYYPEGSLKVIARYENGQPNGELTSYYPDGKIWRQQVYKEGKLISNKQYMPDGKLEFEDKIE